MDIEQEPSPVPDVTVFRLKGPFTLSTMFDLQGILRAPALKGAIIDLAGVPYMDSAGLGVLLGHFAHSQRSGQKFALANITPRVLTIFQMTHTDQVLPIFPTQAAAEASFSA